MKSCLICDDHPLVREALAGTVRLAWPAAAVTEVGDFPAAWAEAGRGHDMCIADLLMPGANPREGIAGLQRAAPGMAILVVTGMEDDGLLLDLLDMGVGGFVPKTSNGQLIEAALRLIDAGGRYLPSRLTHIAASRANALLPIRALPLVPIRPNGGLSARQLDVLRHVAAGLSTKEIARDLGLAPSTVKTHLSHLQVTLCAKNRMEIAIRARALGLL